MLPIKRILVPTDFGDCSAPAVRLAAEQADKFGAELILLHVVQDLALAMPDAVMPTPVPGPDLGQLIDAGKVGLANLIEPRKLGPAQPANGSSRRLAGPRDRFRRHRPKADLLCVGTHGRTGLASTPRQPGRTDHSRGAARFSRSSRRRIREDFAGRPDD